MRFGVKTYILLCAVGGLMLASCDKAPPLEVPEPNDPVFVLHGEISGNEFDIVAGDNGAYMNTGAELVNGVLMFNGELSNGDFSMELGIYDGFLDRPNHVPEDELQNITPTFASIPKEQLVILRKDMLGNNQAIESVTWYVNGVNMGKGEVPIQEPGKYDVCAFIDFSGSQETEQLCNEIIVGYSRGANFALEYTAELGGNLSAEINSGTSEPYLVTWFIDGDQISSSQLLNNYPGLQQMYTLTAEVHYPTLGVTRRKSVLIDGMTGEHSVNDFTAFEMTSAYDAPDQDFNIKIKIQSNGKTYRSEYADNENSTITITGVEYYGQNDEGKDVYKISGIVNAVVMEMATEKKVPVSFSTVFGVEID